MRWPYHDLRVNKKAWIPESQRVPDYEGREADEAMLAEIVGNADLQPQD